MITKLSTMHCSLCELNINAQPFDNLNQSEIYLESGLCHTCLSDLNTFVSKQSEINLVLEPEVQRLIPIRKFNNLYAVSWYEDPFSKWLRKLKFENHSPSISILAQLLHQSFCHWQTSDSWDQPDLIIPMPLSRWRLLNRGFNQATQIAQAAQLNIRIENNLLVRTRHTQAQSGLGKQARINNLRRAFSVKQDLSGLHILLLDDVITTGSTSNAAAEALYQAGAAQVDVACICISPLD